MSQLEETLWSTAKLGFLRTILSSLVQLSALWGMEEGKRRELRLLDPKGHKSFGSSSLAICEAERENGLGVNGLRMSEPGLFADGFLGLSSPCADETVGLRSKTFFASSSGSEFENPTLDGPGKEGLVSLKPMHVMAYPSNPSHGFFKTLSKPRASGPCLLETEELGAKEVEKVSYVANAKMSDYGVGVLES